jgi:peptidoglycan glycosyltransferase
MSVSLRVFLRVSSTVAAVLLASSGLASSGLVSSGAARAEPPTSTSAIDAGYLRGQVSGHVSANGPGNEPGNMNPLGVASSRRVRMETIARGARGFVATLQGGGQAELTLEPRLQDAADEILRSFQVPYGAAVVVSVPDGRVLALAGRSAVSPELGPEELALHAWAPAASVFKIVSAAALISEGGLHSDSRVCYHGGVSSVRLDNLVNVPRIDTSCATLAYGLSKSQNAILAKLASIHLNPDQLERVARSFGFGQPIPFDIPVEPSHIDIPGADRLEFARMAAGFWHSTLSPLHGALLAATVANHGEMPAARIIERATGSEGQPIAFDPLPARIVMTPGVAAEVGAMMELTTRTGTAKTTFNNRKGRPVLAVSVAGKTGTLSAQTDKGYVGYSWFIGYAPAEHPQIAFAVVLGNQAAWRIKAPYVGRGLVAAYLAGAKERGPGPRLLAVAH